MPRRWSKLQRRMHEIFDPNIRLQFQCAIYRIPGHVDTVCPRYFLMLNGEIIWDWPRDYMADLNYEEIHLVYSLNFPRKLHSSPMGTRETS